MTNFNELISADVLQFFKQQLDIDLPVEKITINDTRPEFEGEYTLVTFPLAGLAKSNPVQLGEDLGTYLKANTSYVEDYNVVKGFLNLSLSADYWQNALTDLSKAEHMVLQDQNKKLVFEYCSPNTNKPLHLGHIRNILVGWSVGQILDAVGNKIHYTQIINDRGIAICKSMLAWNEFGNGETPEASGLKGDHFVGKFYVLFNTKLNEEYLQWQQSESADQHFDQRKDQAINREDFFKNYKNAYFNENSTLGADARAMLLKWEANDPEIRALWSKMNQWVYQGFKSTFDKLAVRFDSINYESETYLLGLSIIEKGLADGVFYRKDDGSIWIDLTDQGLDNKLVLRSDGTSVYITQDLGTANMRYNREQMDGMIYTVGNEQDYHFKALFATLKKLGEPYADRLKHLSYGMVDLPSGKMKSREGTVVDADDLISEVVTEARKNLGARGDLEVIDPKEAEQIVQTVGLGALKYFMLRVDAKKRMLFDPKESVDMQGQTGPYIQYAYVRCKSILNKSLTEDVGSPAGYQPQIIERDLLRHLMSFNATVHEAAKNLDPAVVAQYAYNLAKKYHKFNHNHSVLKAESSSAMAFRLSLVEQISKTLTEAMRLLGISMPSRM